MLLVLHILLMLRANILVSMHGHPGAMCAVHPGHPGAARQPASMNCMSPGAAAGWQAASSSCVALMTPGVCCRAAIVGLGPPALPNKGRLLDRRPAAGSRSAPNADVSAAAAAFADSTIDVGALFQKASVAETSNAVSTLQFAAAACCMCMVCGGFERETSPSAQP